MERGDFSQLAGCSFLWHSQENELIPHEEVSLVVLAPTVSGALRDELRLLGCEASQHEPGIFRVAGLPFAAWLVETDVMAERGQPVLSLVSRVFLNNRGRIIEELESTGHESLVRYMVQQIQQFHSWERVLPCNTDFRTIFRRCRRWRGTPDQDLGGGSSRATVARAAARKNGCAGCLWRSVWPDSVRKMRHAFANCLRQAGPLVSRQPAPTGV